MTPNSFIQLTNDRKLCYSQFGDPNGFPLFFFHGWPGSRLQGKGLNKIARKNKIRIIATDRPGSGLSDYYKGRTLLDFPDDIIALANHLGLKKFSILGNSGGGPYAAVCAYKISNRLHKVGITVGLSPTNITGVLRGMAFRNQAIWFLYHYIPLLMKINSWGLYLKDKLFPRNFIDIFNSKADREMLTNEMKTEILVNRKEAFRQGIKGVAQDLKLYTNDWGFEVKNIHSRVYLWYGLQDKMVSIEMGRYYKKHITNSKLKLYPDVGHLLLKKYAEEILRELSNY